MKCPKYYFENISERKLFELLSDVEFKYMISKKVHKFERHIDSANGYGVGHLIYIWKRLQMYQTGDWGFTPSEGNLIIKKLFTNQFESSKTYDIFLKWLSRRQ